MVAVFLSIVSFPSDCWSGEDNGQIKYNYFVGQEVQPEALLGALPLSAVKKLTLDRDYNLLLSNVPEMPVEPGVLCRVDDVLSSSGKVRVLFSHLNLLIDWRKIPIVNVPATAGFAVENNSSRKLEVFADRSALAVNRSPEGGYLFKEDAAPKEPGSEETLYYGTAAGNFMIQQWYLSQDSSPVFIGSMDPGGRVIISGDVGARGWITGMYDLSFRDSATGRTIKKEDFAPGESVGVRTFITRRGEDISLFLDQRRNKNQVLPANSNLHMRGLFRGDAYPDNPHGEAVSKRLRVNYDARTGRSVKFALAAGKDDQSFNPDKANYRSGVFMNDIMRNGLDPFSEGKKGVNGGNYGVDYSIEIKANGPTALILQGALDNNSPEEGSFIDLYNQILTFRLDGMVKTVFLKDINYNSYFTAPQTLRPLGYGKVIGVFPVQGEHSHILDFVLPPNSYGPVRFYLVPLAVSK
ncbi:MAG: hypothetical protein HGA27_02525 [Peptococcaceae bacterium]|nr:hypothetical protein [Peptococcaceae bacterium]